MGAQHKRSDQGASSQDPGVFPCDMKCPASLQMWFCQVCPWKADMVESDPFPVIPFPVTSEKFHGHTPCPRRNIRCDFPQIAWVSRHGRLGRHNCLLAHWFKNEWWLCKQFESGKLGRVLRGRSLRRCGRQNIWVGSHDFVKTLPLSLLQLFNHYLNL